MKISQTPPLRRRMGWRRMSQSLNSPATVTQSALGAHTAKRTPGTPSHLGEVRAQGAVGFVERALGVQVEVGIGELRAEAVGVVDFDFAAVPQARAQSGSGRGIAVQQWRRRSPAGAACSMAQRGRPPPPPRPIPPAGETRAPPSGAGRLSLADAVRPEDAERVAVISANYRFDLFSSHEILIDKYGRFPPGNAQSRAAFAPGRLGRARNAARAGPRARRSKSCARSTSMPISTVF